MEKSAVEFLSMESLPSLLYLYLAPPVVGMFAIWVLLWLRGEFRRKSPVSKKVCRYPGYTLSQKLEVQDERLMFCFMLMFLIPAVTLCVVATGSINFASKGNKIFWILVYLLGASIPIIYSYFLVLQLRRTRMGLKGERIVGQKLEELRCLGFHIYHDLPMDFGNIDHVAVGPPGVFAIETKYRRKKRTGKNQHRVKYDGKYLHFPDCRTDKSVVQAERQASELADLLRSIYGELRVIPILVYPGWFIEPYALPVEVHVHNENNLEARMRKAPQVLPEENVKKIASFLEDKCRDVEV